MIEKELILENRVGLHARPAAKLVETSNRFESKITVDYNGRTANAKSILNILALGAEHGAKIKVSVEGNDEEAAMQAIEELISNRFYEE
ncbi:MAG: HPr family phosphocarrier protein [Candidatus Thermoplasmatota archaeon]|nr:HPr family phosphocarrier protein [Candidatus Thermoplasmatota archaeon]